MGKGVFWGLAAFLLTASPADAVDMNQQLLAAAREGRVEKVRSLLLQGADGNAGQIP